MAYPLSSDRSIALLKEYVRNSGITIMLCLLFVVFYLAIMLYLPEQRQSIIESLGVKDHLDYGLLTAVFVHARFQHIMGNSIGILGLGAWLENNSSKTRYLISIFVCTIGAWLFYILRSPEKVAIGSSGLVYTYWTGCTCSRLLFRLLNKYHMGGSKKKIRKPKICALI